MENQIYKIEMSNNSKLEFYVSNTNEINPLRDIKEMGVIVFNENNQIDGGIDENELNSLIKYLINCKEYI